MPSLGVGQKSSLRFHLTFAGVYVPCRPFIQYKIKGEPGVGRADGNQAKKDKKNPNFAKRTELTFRSRRKMDPADKRKITGSICAENAFGHPFLLLKSVPKNNVEMGIGMISIINGVETVLYGLGFSILQSGRDSGETRKKQQHDISRPFQARPLSPKPDSSSHPVLSE